MTKISVSGDARSRVYYTPAKRRLVATKLTPVAWILDADHMDEGQVLLDFIFDNTKATKLIMFLKEAQASLINEARSVGFKQEGRLKKADTSGDLIILGQYR